MNYRCLVIFVEGADDERFFERTVKSKFEERYDSVILWPYGQKKRTKVRKFLKSIAAMGRDYIFVADLDREPCVTRKKEQIRAKLRLVDEDKIVVVVKEIESWYLAGLDAQSEGKLGVQAPRRTDNIDKEQFNNLIPDKLAARIPFLLELLNHFSVQVAKRKNASFKYLLEKHCCKN